MKKVILFSIAMLMAACPVACVNDPTADDSTSSDVCLETEVETDGSTSCLVTVDEAAEYLDETGTGTAN